MINSVAIMKPKTTLLGVVPVSFKIFKPILLCKFTSSKAKASTKSPKNKKIIVLPKLAPTSAIFITFKNGKRINSQRLKLPTGKILDNEARNKFEVDRIKIDVMLAALRGNK